MLNTTKSFEQVTLYYREGASDKVYQAAIESKQDGYAVNFAYGRRGSTLTTGTKTTTPVAYERAKQLYDKLVAEKTAKGYAPGENSTPYRHGDKRATGILPQLLNTIHEGQLGVLLRDRQHIMQEKHDGRRLMLRKQDGTLAGINKLGLLSGFPAIIGDECHTVEMDFLIDGEIVGDQYHAFDLLELGESNLRGCAYQTRCLYLVNLLASFRHPHITLVESASEPRQKRELFERLKAENSEGVVFKRSDAVHVAGRPHSGGSQLKFKFHETASFIVEKANRKRSVSLVLLDGEKLVPVGNVTIPANHDLPQVGACVEVRYLYAYFGGCIFQPVYLGVRDDIRAEECVIGQLKYKA